LGQDEAFRRFNSFSEPFSRPVKLERNYSNGKDLQTAQTARRWF
jgi:hypothetical protein